MEALHYFSVQVPVVDYATVRAARVRWREQRRLYSSIGPPSQQPYKVHFYTVASHNKTELQNLEFTARLAGVELEVLGLGLEYTSWLQKMEWYATALLEDSNNKVADDDVLVLLDAYDVLLTPLVRQLGQRLSRAATPLLACAENGQYPEPEAAWLYARGTTPSVPPRTSFSDPNSRRQEGGSARFLNSGCLAGRGGDVKNFLREIYHEMTLVQDDQQVFVRHLLRNPHVLSIESADMRQELEQKREMRPPAVFQCGWRVPLDAFTELTYTGAAMLYGQLLSVGVFHMNNRQSEPLYNTLVTMYRRLHSTCFEGRYGARILRALHLAVDGEMGVAQKELKKLEQENKGREISDSQLACLEHIRWGKGLPERGRM